MPILSKTSYLIFIVSNFLGTVQNFVAGFFVCCGRKFSGGRGDFALRAGRGCAMMTVEGSDGYAVSESAGCDDVSV